MSPVRRRQENRRSRRWLVGLVLIVAFLLAVLMPGPNGLVRILVRRYRVESLGSEIDSLRTVRDTLVRQRARLLDPDYALEYARRCLGAESVPSDSD